MEMESCGNGRLLNSAFQVTITPIGLMASACADFMELSWYPGRRQAWACLTEVVEMNTEAGIRFVTESADAAAANSSNAPFAIDEALNRVAGDMDLLKEIAALFLSGCNQSLTDVSKALADDDVEKLISSAHSLKGSVGNFAAERAFLAARNVEHSARDGDLEGARQALATLSLEIELLKKALEQIV